MRLEAAGAVLKLPRLPSFPLQQSALQRYWDQLCNAIEGNDAAQAGLIEQLQAQQAQLTGQQEALEAAQADLAAQLALIQATQRRDAISSSWPLPAQVLTASDAGTDAKVNVLAHTRVYGDETKLEGLAAHEFTGLAYSTTYGVYYDDPTRSDTTPDYQITTDLKLAQHNYVAGRHLVGEVTTPAAGGASTGGGSAPPGSGGGGGGWINPQQ